MDRLSLEPEYIGHVASLLQSNDRAIRSAVHDELRKNSEGLLLVSHMGDNPTITDPQDLGVGRGLYIDGVFPDYDHLRWIVPKVQERRSLPRILLDVGANIGPICIRGVSSGLFERAVAVEPHPRNCRLLRANIALSGLHDRIAVHEAAAGLHDDALLAMEISPDNSGDHRVTVTSENGLYGETARSKFDVRSRRLDALVPPEDWDDVFVWMDVQGYEGFALAGAKAMLARRPPLFFELWPYGLRRTGSFGRIIAALRNYDGFYDARDPSTFRPIEDLLDLHDALGDGIDFTDVLVL